MDVFKRYFGWFLLIYTGLSSADIVVTDITLVSSQRVSRVEVEYTFQVQAQNTGPSDALNVTATVASPFTHTQVLDGDLIFGDIPPGGTITSSDTFTVRNDRRFILDPAALQYTFSFAVPDVTAPSLQFNTPTNGATVDTTLPILSVAFTDDGSGIDENTFRLFLNGTDVTPFTSITAAGATYSPSSPLPAGDNQAVAEVADREGNVATVSINFTVSVFRAIADCSPTAGTTPLTVRFQTRGEFTGGSIERYRWDFDGNGSFNTNDAVARDYSFTFRQQGTYTALLQVINNLGAIATDTCSIQVGGNAPIASANANPSNGPIPLDVNFTCTGSDTDGSIVGYEWDFEGDGIYDYSSATSGSVTHSYTVEGTYTAACRVTDNDGLTGLARTTTTLIRPALPGSPSVTASASPSTGNAPMSVSFNGSAIDDGTVVLWEWDFDGDGVFDFSSTTSPATSFTYTDAGIFAASLRATDNDGNAGIDSVEVVANATASLSIPVDTFQPDIGVVANINTQISAGLPVRVLLKDQQGTVVRTLVDEQRVAGSYSDAWDGTDDSGNLLPEGPYYAVLEYDFGGDVVSVDLTNTTGGTRYNPPRSRIPSSFSPFDGTPLTIDFTLTRGASEVTAFIGRFRSNVRLVTFMERRPMGSGTHRIVWNGENADGQLIHPPSGDRFLFGIWGYTLPDNAIYLRSGAHISNLSVTPSIYDPTGHEDDQGTKNPSRLTFDLSKTADVELVVSDAESGVTVARRYYPALSAGNNTVAWDGLDDSGLYVAHGRYRLGVSAIDSTGYRSLRIYTLQRVYY